MVHASPFIAKSKSRQSHNKVDCSQPKNREAAERFVLGLYICVLLSVLQY